MLNNDKSNSVVGNLVDIQNDSLEDDVEYYKYLSGYNYLLNKEDFDSITNKINGMEENQELRDRYILSNVEFLFKEFPDYKEKISAVIDDVKSKKSDEKYFEKNTACVGLESNIKANFSQYPSNNEEYEFIFYSPTFDSCIYVTNVSYSSSYGEYVSTETKNIYKAGLDSPIASYQVYSSDNYENKDKAEESKENVKKFVTYVLENSNYNMELLDNSSYVYVSY